MSWGRGDNGHGGSREDAPSAGGQNAPSRDVGKHRQSFILHAERPRVLLIGANAGIAPTIAFAERLRGSLTSSAGWKPLVLLGSDQSFPFRPRPSSIIVAGIPTGVIACMPLLEEWGVPCRLASHADLPGCFDGLVTGLADAWLASLGPAELSQVEIFARGPAALLEGTREVASHYGVPCD
jgi:dihydroorotate dehydrogenase electron transfer subunit